jgi:Fe-S oxidoreductase/nitrate reductase gamma subunit
MNAGEPTRLIYWNVSHVWLMYVLFLPTLTVAMYGVWRRVSQWRQGSPLARFNHPLERIRLLLTQVLAHRRLMRDPFMGLLHGMIFFGFLALTAATTVVALDADAGFHIMHGKFYLYFQSLTVDIFGGLVLLAVVMAAVRRYVWRPRYLTASNEAFGILALLFAIVLSGFLLEGWRIVATNDPWAAWSPLGQLAASLSSKVMSVSAMQQAHAVLWWGHLALSFVFIAWFPYTKMLHVIAGPLNIYTANLDRPGASLKPVDFESGTSLGVNSLGAFTWKDLLDLDACTECGRCTLVCPANKAGKDLSPSELILELRSLMHSTRATPGKADGQDTPAPLIGAKEAISPERLWQCTTCGACVEACPVFIEQMPKIVDLRRYLVMEEADFPASLQEAVTSLEAREHPFRGTQATRLTWTEGLEIPSIKDQGSSEVLFWVGCSSALIDRNQKIARATANLLKVAGVQFAILGREEKCCGDPARRIGNEFLFEKLAGENIATLNLYGVKKVVTSCPHCFNTLKNEYPRLGGEFEVIHHSEFLAQLVHDGRLKPQSTTSKITFHDPCYLGRQNGVLEAPRQILRQISSTGFVEMARNRRNGFCCGGGGGMSFVEEPPSQRVNQERAVEALATGADTLAVACSFCMTMMEDGVNARKGDQNMCVKDISELLWDSVQASETASSKA